MTFAQGIVYGTLPSAKECVKSEFLIWLFLVQELWISDLLVNTRLYNCDKNRIHLVFSKLDKQLLGLRKEYSTFQII